MDLCFLTFMLNKTKNVTLLFARICADTQLFKFKGMCNIFTVAYHFHGSGWCQRYWYCCLYWSMRFTQYCVTDSYDNNNTPHTIATLSAQVIFRLLNDLLSYSALCWVKLPLKPGTWTDAIRHFWALLSKAIQKPLKPAFSDFPPFSHHKVWQKHIVKCVWLYPFKLVW